MTSRNSFWKLSFWNFKKRIWVFLICLSVWFFAIPVAGFVAFENRFENMNGLAYSNIQWISQQVISTNIMGDGVYGVLAVILGIFIGLQSFVWVNNKAKVDLYKSVPIKEGIRFLYINLNSFLMFFIAFAFNMFLTNMIFVSKGIYSSKMLYASLFSILIHVLLFVATYVITLIAVYLTGNVVLGFFGSCILLVLEPVLLITRSGLLAKYIHTYYDMGMNTIISKGIFSPISPWIGMYSKIAEQVDDFSKLSNYSASIGFLVLLVIQNLVFIGVAYVLYRKRPSLTGGNAIVFPKIKPALKCLLCISASIVAAVIFASLNQSRQIGYGLFGLVCCLIIMQIVVQTILEGDFRKCMTGIPSFCISIVASLFLFLVMAKDLTGYETYLPKTDEIESFAIVRDRDYRNNYFDDEGNWIRVEQYLFETLKIDDENSKNILVKKLQQAIDENAYYYEDDDSTQYAVDANVMSTVDAGMLIDANSGEMQNAETSKYENDEFPDYEKENLIVLFRLKNGKKVYRTYNLSKNLVRECQTVFFENEKFIEQKYEINQQCVRENYMDGTKDNSISIRSYGESDWDNGIYIINPETIKQLYEAIVEDLKNRDYQMILDEAPIAQMNMESNRNNVKERSNTYLNVPIYSSDAHVMQIIKENNWEIEKKIEPDMFSVITIKQCFPDLDGYKKLELHPGDALYEEVIDAMIHEDVEAEDDAYKKSFYWVEAVPSDKQPAENDTVTNYELSRIKFPKQLSEMFKNAPFIRYEDDKEVDIEVKEAEAAYY